MNVKEFFQNIKIDGVAVENVVQVTVDEEKVTVVYEKSRGATDPIHRVLTVESEAVTIG